MCKQTLPSVISVRSSSDTMTSILSGGTAQPMIIQRQNPSAIFTQIYIHEIQEKFPEVNLPEFFTELLSRYRSSHIRIHCTLGWMLYKLYHLAELFTIYVIQNWNGSVLGCISVNVCMTWVTIDLHVICAHRLSKKQVHTQSFKNKAWRWRSTLVRVNDLVLTDSSIANVWTSTKVTLF